MATMRPFGFPGGDPFRELRRLRDGFRCVS